MARTKRIYRVVGVWTDDTTLTRNYQTEKAAKHRADIWLSPMPGSEYWPSRAVRVELYESEPIVFGDEPSFVYQPFMYGRGAGDAS